MYAYFAHLEIIQLFILNLAWTWGRELRKNEVNEVK